MTTMTMMMMMMMNIDDDDDDDDDTVHVLKSIYGTNSFFLSCSIMSKTISYQNIIIENITKIMLFLFFSTMHQQDDHRNKIQEIPKILTQKISKSGFNLNYQY